MLGFLHDFCHSFSVLLRIKKIANVHLALHAMFVPFRRNDCVMREEFKSLSILARTMLVRIKESDRRKDIWSRCTTKISALAK